MTALSVPFQTEISTPGRDAAKGAAWQVNLREPKPALPVMICMKRTSSPKQSYTATLRRGGNLASLRHVISTGNVRAACAMVFTGLACALTCVMQRAGLTTSLRRRKVLLLTYQGPARQRIQA